MDAIARVTQQIGFEITAPGSLTTPKTELVRTYRLKHKINRRPALVYWLGVPMTTKFQPARITIRWPRVEPPQPVLVDLLDGGVYALPHAVRSGQLCFENLPLADPPLVVCSRDAVERAVP